MMHGKLLRLLVAGVLMWSGVAGAATVSIRTDTDTRRLKVGDSVTFTFSVDWIAPPIGYQWETLTLKSFQIARGSQVQSLFTSCTNVSGLPPQIFPAPEFSSGFGCASWTWIPYAPQPISGVRGDLFTVTARFTEPGAYAATLSAPVANFFKGKGVASQQLSVSPAIIVIHVSSDDR